MSNLEKSKKHEKKTAKKGFFFLKKGVHIHVIKMPRLLIGLLKKGQ